MASRTLIRSMSSMVKNLVKEPHPYFIDPVSQRAQSIELSFITRRIGRSAALYVPVAGGFFGWCLATSMGLNYANGVTGSPWNFGAPVSAIEARERAAAAAAK